MKYNTTYTPTISLRNTIEKTELVLDSIKKLYKSKYKILKLIPPLFFEEDQIEFLNIPKVTRSITFDTSDEYKVGKLLLSHTNWLRTMFKKLEIKNKEALLIESSVIWRDLPINPISSITKNELTIQIKVDKSEDIKEKVNIETEALYSLIKDFEVKFSEEFELNEILPEYCSYVSGQMLENEYPDVNAKTREEYMVEELKAFILRNPSDKLFSGHLHTSLPEEVYAIKNFNQLVIMDTTNTSVLKVASVAQIATGELLSDQLSITNKSYLKEIPFYAEEIENDYNIIEIKINIGRLMMALLKKGHISEVQPGNISNESNIISTRYKVEKY